MPEKNLSADELQRYARHIVMPEFGIDAQRKLKAASVIIIGAGGLGSPAALYLAAAGIGKIGVVDFDDVSMSNLQRQILYGTGDIGRPKTRLAEERIRSLNPNVKIETYKTALEASNALDILSGFDIILDATDNFATRYLVNDASCILKKPNIYGSIIRFEGQVSVFDPNRGPCYRCLFPAPPPPHLVPNCADGGVLGVLPGIIGSMQALEAMKVITGIGQPLIGRLVLFDGLSMRMMEIAIAKDPACPSCSENPEIRTLSDLEHACRSIREVTIGEPAKDEITPRELESILSNGKNLFLLDVREPGEYDICNLGGHLIPLGELPRRLGEIDATKPIVVHCKSGARSASAVTLLKNAGFRDVRNLAGGIDAWAEQVDAHLQRY
ncbi:MAG TPA: molybdopterin-synthase adenylyltransferase MoeB [Bacteroidota bacterium]|nr:molybdopterin-synthase adenylyltransferase MoeB [Bacteroidota bacterium]